MAVSNLATSIDYYTKIGFKYIDTSPTSVARIRNGGGLELHLCFADQGIEDDKNILMDFSDIKYPGHTHMSFSVPNTPNAAKYLESLGLLISGERRMGGPTGHLWGVFTRDPDRTTIEYEKNSNDQDDVEVTAANIGYPQSIDHIGKLL